MKYISTAKMTQYNQNSFHSINNSLIATIKHNYSFKTVITSSIKAYCEMNNLDYSGVTNLPECGRYTQQDDGLTRMLTSFQSFTLKDMESILENLIDKERKVSEGVVYTPEYIIDYIIEYSLSIYDANDIPIVCDPACGSGGFLLRAIDLMSKKYGKNMSDIVKCQIKGIDISPEAVSCTKIMIELFLLSKNIIPPMLNNIVCADTLVTRRENLLDMIDAPHGIDILVTNPPYVKLQHIPTEYRKLLTEMFSNYANGNFSLAMLFLVKGYDLLSERGVLGYITQNNLFTSLAGRNIRQYIQNEKSLHTIVDFVHTKIFANVSAYTCLMFLTKEKNEHFYFRWCLHPTSQLATTPKDNFSRIAIPRLHSKKWRLAPLNHLDNLSIIETIGTPLNYIAEIKVGFATLKDSVFILRKDIGIDIEDEVTRPAIKVSELPNQGSINNFIMKVIFPYKRINNKWVIIPENEFKNRYPNAYGYLKSHKDILLTRDKGKRRYKVFYEWGRTQGMDAKGPKLLTKTFSRHPNFILDTTDSLFCNGYAVSPKHHVGLFGNTIDIIVLQKILNSAIMDYYAKLTTFQLNGNYQCFQKNFIEHFSIPQLSHEDIEFITNNGDNKELDIFLCNLYGLRYDDIIEITNR